MDTEIPILELKELSGNTPIEFNDFQTALIPHTEGLLLFWWCVWVATSGFLLYTLLKQMRK